MGSIQVNQNSDNQHSWKQDLDMMGCSNVNSYKWCFLFVGYTENTGFQFARNAPLPWCCYWKFNIICLKDLEQEVFLRSETALVHGVAAVAWSHWGQREQVTTVAAFTWLYLASHVVAACDSIRRQVSTRDPKLEEVLVVEKGAESSLLFLTVLKTCCVL